MVSSYMVGFCCCFSQSLMLMVMLMLVVLMFVLRELLVECGRESTTYRIDNDKGCRVCFMVTD
jgi:hypothetical protein